MIHHKPTVIDACCGAGGFSEGFRQAGFKIILGIDNWNVAAESYRLNQKTDVIISNIEDINELPDCDVFIGSPPCQCFSIQKYARVDNKKIDLSVFNHFQKLYKSTDAEYWIWENTPLSAKHVNLPYNIIDAQFYGVQQRRKRVFYGNYPLPYPFTKYDNVAPTIVAWELSGGWKNANGRRFSQWLNRKPTYQEIAYYMGFPDSYVFTGKQHYKSLQIGNAVCPPVSKAIAEGIMNEIS